MRGLVTASTWIPHAEHCSCFPDLLLLGLVLTLHWMAQSGLWQASFGGMNSITSEGLNALAQAPCLCADLATALFKKKALGLSGNKILAPGQRSVYTHWPSLCSLYGFPFTRKLWKLSSEEVLECLCLCPKKEPMENRHSTTFLYLWLHIKGFKNKLPKLESSSDTHGFCPPHLSPKAVVVTDFCCGASDVPTSYVYCSICVCSERSKFVLVHLTPGRRGSHERFPPNAEPPSSVSSVQGWLNVTLPFAVLFWFLFLKLECKFHS